MTLGKYISMVRAKKQISQIDLANACDIGTATISRIELDKALPRISTLIKLENALGLKQGELCNFNEQEETGETYNEAEDI